MQQKQLCYYLNMAGLAGRDIMWDQNYRHNLKIRRALEAILKNYKGERTGADWDDFMVYAKQVFFSNGIHHHYSNDKHMPEFVAAWFEGALKESGATLAPEVLAAIFDPAMDAKKVSLDADKDLVLASAVNFYGDGREREGGGGVLCRHGGPNAAGAAELRHQQQAGAW